VSDGKVKSGMKPKNRDWFFTNPCVLSFQS